MNESEKLAAALAIIRQLEWSHEHGACPICRACPNCAKMDGREFEGHREDCALDAVLRVAS